MVLTVEKDTFSFKLNVLHSKWLKIGIIGALYDKFWKIAISLQ